MGRIFITKIEDQSGDKEKHVVNVVTENESNYIAVKDAYLRLKLDKHINKSTIKLSTCPVGTCVNMGTGIIMANARSNMNPFVVKAKEDKENALYIMI